MTETHTLISNFLYHSGLENFIDQGEYSNLLMEYTQANTAHDYEAFPQYKLSIVLVDMSDFIERNIPILRDLYGLHAFKDDDIRMYIMIYVESFLLSTNFMYDHTIDSGAASPLTEMLYAETQHNKLISFILSKNPNMGTGVSDLINMDVLIDVSDGLGDGGGQVSAVGWKIRQTNTTLWVLLCKY